MTEKPSKARLLEKPFEIGGRIVNPLSGTVTWRGEQAHMVHKEIEVLACLASAPMEVVRRQQMIDDVWDGNWEIGDKALTDTVYTLRRVTPCGAP